MEEPKAPRGNSKTLTEPLAKVSLFWRGQAVRLSKNFSLVEYECKCSACSFTLVSIAHIDRLEKLRQRINYPIKISSAYRCPTHNRTIGGAKESQHIFGTATDIVVPQLSTPALYALCVDIFDGVGLYDTFVHVDSRGYESRWDLRSIKEKKKTPNG